jgi:mycothiol synthase
LDLDDFRLPHVAPGEYTVRGLRPDEADKLTHIQNRAFADSWGFNPNTSEEIAYRINLSWSSPENIVVVCLKNQIAGYCWMRLMTPENPEAGGIEGEIHMLGVDPDLRRRGIGRRVLLAGLSHLKHKGITIARLTADGEDPAPLALYESVGFEMYSRMEWYEKRLV